MSGIESQANLVGRFFGDFFRHAHGEPATLARFSERCFLLGMLLVPLAFSTRSFEAFLTLKQFLALSFLWWSAVVYGAAWIRGEVRLPGNPVVYWLLVLLGVFIASALHAGRWEEGWFTLVGIAVFGAVFPAVVSACGRPGFRASGIRMLLLTGFVGASYGLLQVLDLDFLNAIFDLWVRTEGKRGIFSTFGNPNFLAEYLVLCFPFLLAQYVAAQTRRERAILGRLMVLFATAILACGTRGVWLGFVVAVLAFVLLVAVFSPKWRSSAIRALGLSTLILVLGAALLMLAGPREREETFAERSKVLAGEIGISGEARLLAWRVAFEEMIPPSAPFDWFLRAIGYRRPAEATGPPSPSVWLGSGPSSFRLDFLRSRGRYFRRLQGDDHRRLVDALNYQRLHNEVLQLFVEGGLLGIGLLFLAATGFALTFLRCVRRETEGRRLERIAAVCALLGPGVHALFSFPAHLASTAVAATFVAGLAVSGGGGNVVRRREKAPAWALALCLVLAVAGEAVFLRPFLADIVRKQVESTSTGKTREFDRRIASVGLALEPLNGPLHFALAKTAYDARDYETAEKESRLALRGIQDLSLYTLLGIALYSQNKLEEAEAMLQEAYAISGGDPKILYYVGLAQSRAGKTEEAVVSFRKAVDGKGDLFLAWRELGNLYGGKLRRPRRALESFRQAASVKPDDAYLLGKLAFAHLALGERDAGQRVLERVVKLAPTEVSAWVTLGDLHGRNQEFEKALRCFETAVSLAPSAAELWFRLALVRDALGRADEALEAVGKALELKPGDPRAERLRRKIVAARPEERRPEASSVSGEGPG